MKILLCGLPASGKTRLLNTLSSVSADELKSFNFIDLDHYIEESQQLKTGLAAFILEQGFEVFRKLEESHLTSLIEQNKQLIISIGGGALNAENVVKFSANPELELVHIDISEQESIRRSSVDGQRPLCVQNDDEMLMKIFRERKRILHHVMWRVNGMLPVQTQALEFLRLLKNFKF
jgi:shikimate kinase